ncbi:hypothetical protein [Streptomyces sp. KL116D]|uniref:hypothetical protein n=1 Tax=Streptomyces sp. KL116D TaxID=3045152 RepID=UPI003558F1DC
MSARPGPLVTVRVSARLTVDGRAVGRCVRALRGAVRAVRGAAVTVGVLAGTAAGQAGGQWAVGRETAPAVLFCVGAGVFADGVRRIGSALRARSRR